MADYLDQTQAMVRDPDGTIRFWSRGAEALYGWSHDEAVGRFSHDLLAIEFPKPAVEIEAEVREHGSWIGELRQRRRDGSTIWVASHWAVHTHAHCAESSRYRSQQRHYSAEAGRSGAPRKRSDLPITV